MPARRRLVFSLPFLLSRSRSARARIPLVCSLWLVLIRWNPFDKPTAVTRAIILFLVSAQGPASSLPQLPLKRHPLLFAFLARCVCLPFRLPGNHRRKNSRITFVRPGGLGLVAFRSFLRLLLSFMACRPSPFYQRHSREPLARHLQSHERGPGGRAPSTVGGAG